MKKRLATLVASLIGVVITALLVAPSMFRAVHDTVPMYHGPSGDVLFAGFVICLVLVGVLIGLVPLARRVRPGWLIACSAAAIILATELWSYTAGGILFVVFHALPFWPGNDEPSALFVVAGQLTVLVLTGWLFGWLLLRLVISVRTRRERAV